MATLLDDWHAMAYEDRDVNQGKKLWEKYFKEEKEIYKQILAEPDREIVGIVSELAEKYGMDIKFFIGFLEGINDSIVKPNPIEKLKENSKVKIKIDKEKLYYNMNCLNGTIFYQKKKGQSFIENVKILR